MISPSTPAALAGIVVGAGPSTRTASPIPSNFASVFVATTHDPPTRPAAVTGPGYRADPSGTSTARAPGERIGTSQDFVHR